MVLLGVDNDSWVSRRGTLERSQELVDVGRGHRAFVAEDDDLIEAVVDEVEPAPHLGVVALEFAPGDEFHARLPVVELCVRGVSVQLAVDRLTSRRVRR